MTARTLLLCSLVALAIGCTEDANRDELGLPISPDPVTVGFDEPVEYAGVEVKASKISAFEQTPGGFPRISVVVRSENKSDRGERNPFATLLCDESDVGGEWTVGSTWAPEGILRMGTVKQGEAYLEFPNQPDSIYPLLVCTNPRVQFSLVDNLGAVQHVLLPVPDEVITDAVNASRGPELPYPLPAG